MSASEVNLYQINQNLFDIVVAQHAKNNNALVYYNVIALPLFVFITTELLV